MASSLIFADIFRNMQFCNVIQYIVSKKDPVRIAQEVLVESLESVFNEAHFLVNLRSFFQHLALPPSSPLRSPQADLSPKYVICTYPIPQAEQLPQLSFSRHSSNSLTVYIFLISEP